MIDKFRSGGKKSEIGGGVFEELEGQRPGILNFRISAMA